jgi:hypothetical protein
MASVWTLLDQAYEAFGVFPTLLERDFNLPAADELLQEVARIRSLQEQHQDHAGDARRKQA